MTPPFKPKHPVLFEALTALPHAHAEFCWSESLYPIELVEEIAIGQSVGSWDEKVVSKATLSSLCARVTNCQSVDGNVRVTISFPLNLWHGRLDWLLTLLFGKMSFFEGVQLNDLQFDPSCFEHPLLKGPQIDLAELRSSFGLQAVDPFLMGILKPNVAMSDDQIADLVLRAGSSGAHLIKDDEIRHDADAFSQLSRVQAVASSLEKHKVKTLYAVHLQIDQTGPGLSADHIKRLESAGASALLLNVWTCGLGTLQKLRSFTQLPILAHPALVGAFGITESTCHIHPRVSLASFLRAAGADFTLFPSPYGKLGLSPSICKSIVNNATQESGWGIKKLIPVPSAGIKPEHAPLARRDFGSDFVLNAGTAIFANAESIESNVQAFQKALYQI